MIFLFEDVQYNSSYLGDCIEIGRQDGFNTLSSSPKENSKTEPWTKVNGVGYHYYNDRPIFVLPKVFYDKETKKAFGEDVLPNGKDVFGNTGKVFKDSDPARQFLSGLGLWLYSAIQKYRDNSEKEKNGVNAQENLESVKFKKNERCSTLPDIVSSMEIFYKKNQSLFVFVAKCKHSGKHKIDWHKTVSRKTPFLQNGVPIYMEMVNKVKAFDLDDRLLVLYFSAMNYVHAVYGLPMPKSEFYQPLKVGEVKRLLEDERGVRELRRIKYKYFDDRLLKLYNIVESFFRWGAEFSKKNSKAKEYLIVNSFNNVFETMIDDLVSDPGADVRNLKRNKDGKIIDHLYKERSLILAENTDERIWHIGDSKYYKDISDLDQKSISKQFTYAKNLIQDFFSPRYFGAVDPHEHDVHKSIRYRDDLTEGYSVTPNFFIRGDLPLFVNKYQYGEEYFRSSKKEALVAQADCESAAGADDGVDKVSNESMEEYLWRIRNRHFENRLFDRDTLLLQVYNVNFLYVLKAYISSGGALRDRFRKEARSLFRKDFLNLLTKKYVFLAVWPKKELAENDILKSMIEGWNVAAPNEMKAFVLKHNRLLVGKMFRPKGVYSLILALEKKDGIGTIDQMYPEIWNAIKVDCDLVCKFLPQDIWTDDYLKKAEAVFVSAEYNEAKNGFFISLDEFNSAMQAGNLRLPSKINGREISGACFSEIILNESGVEDACFLPCKS